MRRSPLDAAPVRVPRALHPALKAHGLKVKAAHAHLTQTVPGFRAKPPAVQFQAVQAHIKQRKGGY